MYLILIFTIYLGKNRQNIYEKCKIKNFYRIYKKSQIFAKPKKIRFFCDPIYLSKPISSHIIEIGNLWENIENIYAFFK